MGVNPINSVDVSDHQIREQIDKLDFVMKTKSPHFGDFNIYRMQEKPYEYVMNKVYTSVAGTKTLENAQ